MLRLLLKLLTKYRQYEPDTITWRICRRIPLSIRAEYACSGVFRPNEWRNTSCPLYTIPFLASGEAFFCLHVNYSLCLTGLFCLHVFTFRDDNCMLPEEKQHIKTLSLHCTRIHFTILHTHNSHTWIVTTKFRLRLTYRLDQRV